MVRLRSSFNRLPSGTVRLVRMRNDSTNTEGELRMIRRTSEQGKPRSPSH
jgi:hypothetical protein